MLAFFLAILVGIAGLAVLSTAFFFPNLYRKNDIIWGGVALFYALVLWICARRITGAVLLGQTASVALTGWLGWQALMWRWSQLPGEQRSTIADGTSVKQGFQQIKQTNWKSKIQSSSEIAKARLQQSVKQSASTAQDVAEATAEATETAVEAIASETPVDQSAVEQSASSEAVSEDSPAVTSPITPPSTPKKGAAGLGAVLGSMGSLRDRLQGRKNHGKKYVRSEEKTVSPTSVIADETAQDSSEVAQALEEESKAKPVVVAPVAVEAEPAEPAAEPVTELEAQAGSSADKVFSADDDEESANADGSETADKPIAPEVATDSESIPPADATLAEEPTAPDAPEGVEAQPTEAEANAIASATADEEAPQVPALIAPNRPKASLSASEGEAVESTVEAADETTAEEAASEDPAEASETEVEAEADTSWPPKDESWSDEPEAWEQD